MRVIVEVEYEVDNGSKINILKRRIKEDELFGSSYSSATGESYKYKKILSIRKKEK